MRPTSGAEVPRPSDRKDVAEEVHNAIAGVVRVYATLLEGKQAEIAWLRAENAALRLPPKDEKDAGKKQPQALESDALGG